METRAVTSSMFLVIGLLCVTAPVGRRSAPRRAVALTPRHRALTEFLVPHPRKFQSDVSDPLGHGRHSPSGEKLKVSYIQTLKVTSIGVRTWYWCHLNELVTNMALVMGKKFIQHNIQHVPKVNWASIVS